MQLALEFSAERSTSCSGCMEVLQLQLQVSLMLL